MKIKEELKGFNINIDDIEICDFEVAIKDLCKNIALELDKQRYEIVLNKNIIDIKDTFTNLHSYMGLKLSFESFEKDIGFIVRPNFELSYDELQQKYKQQKEIINKAMDLLNAYIGVLDDTSDLYFENVKSILETVKEK